jgi:hypothetical protein
MLPSLRHFFLRIGFVVPILSRTLATQAKTVGECLHDTLGALQSPEQICLPPERDWSRCTTKSDSRLWNPWAYAPHCVEDSALVEKYCLYTATKFNNNAGISFIIRPEILPAVKAIVQDTALTHRAERYIKRQRQPKNAELSYKVIELPKKGRSVIAVRLIRRGELFMVEFPAIVVDQELERGPDPEISELDRLNLYELGFEQLADADRALSSAAMSGGNIHEDIFKTNAFGINIGGILHSGHFPEIAVSLGPEWSESAV